ncbi:response regulator transcription factor [Paenibacillus nasutitermitis]|uniref:DNA-binding response regulator n=1 Tax=Paenibacillus nasutitermitis TaxID=1652958 RepID=A0A916YLM8_9BACL|nr:response regulator transcription factor [Paenibacillus nasutitermitis]GGD48649.1 DNA-binding response regulator [Paenibacillus nasutitermitis]
MKKILIIEDHGVISKLRKDTLEAGGYAVELAASADAGVQKAMKEPFAMIILDLAVPGRDGFDICKIFRQTADAPIMMILATHEEVDSIRILGLGADDYLVKPYSMDEFMARVGVQLSRHLPNNEQQAHTDTAEISPHNPFRAGILLIDRLARKVYVEECEVALTAKELDLLLYLAANPNRVFTKEELFERVWGLDSMGDLPTVTVHISKLREKIEQNPSKPQVIETVWGSGYRFNKQE